jgi:chromosome segregation ATPase
LKKSALGDLIELLEEEKQTIDEKLQSVEKENSAGEEERIKLADQNEDLKSAILPVSETLERLESQLLILAPRFPPPLQDELQNFLNRIPNKDKRENIIASVSQRLEAVVEALAKIYKFNS